MNSPFVNAFSQRYEEEKEEEEEEEGGQEEEGHDEEQGESKEKENAWLTVRRRCELCKQRKVKFYLRGLIILFPR